MLIFSESFDHWPTDAHLRKWTDEFTNDIVIEAGEGRFSTRGGHVLNPSSNFANPCGIQRTIPESATYIVGFAFRPGLTNGTNPIIGFRYFNTTQVDVRFASGTNLLSVTRNGTTLETGTTALTLDVWYYIELKATIHDTTGSYELRINGVTEASDTNVDTNAQGFANINQLMLGSITNVNTQQTLGYYDDLYLCDTVDSGVGGVPNNDFLGDVKVVAIFPNGNGNSSQFDGSDGNSTDNYLLVDEQDWDSDTTYVESNTATEKDTYAYSDVTGTGTVYGVHILPGARKTDAGTRSGVTVARLSGTETDGPVFAPGVSYQYWADIREAKPGGGSWSIANVNSAEFGVKVNS